MRSATEPQYCPIADKYCTCKTRCEWYDEQKVNAYADAMMLNDSEIAQQGEDWSTRGTPLKAGT